MAQQLSGINPVNSFIFYFHSIILPEQAQVLNFILTAETAIANLFTGLLLSCIGRKTALLVGLFILSCAHLSLSIGLFLLEPTNQGPDEPLFVLGNTGATVLIMMGLVLLNGSFGLTLGPIIWLYIPEFS